MKHHSALKALSVTAIVAATAPVAAQTTAYDMTVPPQLAAQAALSVPRVHSAALASSAQLRVVEDRELPLVHITVQFSGGSRLDGSLPGITSFMAGMLDEGAGGRNAATLQSELAFLGARLSASTSWDDVTVSLKVPSRSLDPALNLLADVILRPTFSANDVRTQRDLRLANLLQQRDQPGALAALAFNQLVFPAGHPYHHSASGDSAATARLDSVAVRRAYHASLRPDRATFIVVGDISASEAEQKLARLFDKWQPNGAAATVTAPAVQPLQRSARSIFLIDKPGAAQSIVQIGWPGVERTSPDYAALMVMNTILGGSFTSRLNMNLRETHGYSYGAGSGFSFRRVPGPFTASAAVRTNVTDSSLFEFFKEMDGLRTTVVPSDELERAKSYVELGLPGSLEGTSPLAGEVAELLTFGLTLEELARFAAEVREITADDVQRVARKYLTTGQATVVVVGDLAKIRESIAALSLGDIQILDVSAVAK